MCMCIYIYFLDNRSNPCKKTSPRKVLLIMTRSYRPVQSDFLNDNSMNLQFTGKLSAVSMDFLDVNLAIDNGTMTTSIYRKRTMGNALLRADSGYPSHAVRGVPYRQFLRLRRLCSRTDYFLKLKK